VLIEGSNCKYILLDLQPCLIPAREPSAQEINVVIPGIAPPSPHSQLSSRRNVFDDDEFDRLAIDSSKLHIGRRNVSMTADDILQDRSTAASKAAILSALATFDSDDDERDDTYDTADVGGTVDSTNPEETAESRDTHEETLFKAWQTNTKVFDRDAATRRGNERSALRTETGMTDEALEGWALMLSRDSRQLRRLEAKFETFTGNQQALIASSWRASPAGSGTDDSDGREVDPNDRGRGGRLRSQGRSGAGRGRGRGSVAGPTGDKETEEARRRKDANKGSRANHNRRDQRAKKMARGGFPG
jgi:activating signal cointegrator complex subunit 2